MDMNSLKKATHRINYPKNNKNNIRFGNASVFTTSMELIDRNFAANVATQDICSMIIPRAAIASTRNKEARNEVVIREGFGLFNVTLLPSIIAGSIAGVANKIANPLGIKNNLWINSDSLKLLNSAWQTTSNYPPDKIKNYVNTVLANTKGLNGNTFYGVSKGNLLDPSKEAMHKVSELLINAINEQNPNNAKKLLKQAEETLVTALRADKNLVVNIGKDKAVTSAKKLIKDTHDACKHIFQKSAGSNMPEDIFLKLSFDRFKAVNTAKSSIALALCGGIGFMTQFINRYMTECRTGKKGFVGNINCGLQDKNLSAKEKRNLSIQKGLSMGGFGLLLLGIIGGKNPVKMLNPKNLKSLGSKLQFNSPLLSQKQLQTVFGVTVLGRMAASADKNELRETNIRDVSGFLNWLVLGSFVTKGTASLLAGKNKFELLNQTSTLPKNVGIIQKAKHFILNTSVKSHEEIRKSNVFVSKNIKKLNIATTAGVIYSCLMLGIGIPLFNKYLTNKKNNKSKTSQL